MRPKDRAILKALDLAGPGGLSTVQLQDITRMRSGLYSRLQKLEKRRMVRRAGYHNVWQITLIGRELP